MLKDVQSEFRFKKIWVVPSHYPPQKTAAADFQKRLEWCKKIFKQKPFEVSELEKSSSQTVFGIDIFSHLSLKDPTAQYYWIVGEDQWNQLSFWKSIDSYAPKLEWIVLPRAKVKKTAQPKGLLSKREYKVSISYRMASIRPKPEISSTEIRKALKSKASSKKVFAWIPNSIRKDVLSTYQKTQQGGSN